MFCKVGAHDAVMMPPIFFGANQKMDTWRKIRVLLLTGSLLVLALGWLFSLPMNAHYTDLVVERAYYADPDGKENIQSIQAHDFTPFTGPLFHGNDARPLWLRLTIAPSAHADWVVMYQPNYIHQIETWLPQPDGRWRRVVTGSRYAFNQREVKTLVPAVQVHPAADRAITIYARVQTPTAPLYVRVITRDDCAAFDSLMHMVTGAFMGIALILSLLSFMVYISTRDMLWGLDAIFNLVGLTIITLQLGLASRLLWPDSVNVVNQLVLIANCSYLFMTTVLHRTMFGLFVLPRWIYIPNSLAMLIFPIQLWLIAQGMGDLAMTINNGMIFLLSLWGVLIVIHVRHSDMLMQAGFRAAYLGLLGYFVWWGLPMVLQVQTGNLSTLYPSLPASLFSMLILLLVLLRNTQLKARDARLMALEKREAEQKLHAERQRHEETNSFLGMLLHEVKNPLSTIRMTVSNLENALVDQGEGVQRRLRRVHESVDSIDEVLERGVEVDSLEQGALVLELARVNVAELVGEFLASHAAADRLRLALPTVLVASVDSHLFGLMLRNLIDNAIKYSPEGSSIEISLSSDDRLWQLTVRNVVGAVGFPDADRVFMKYYRSPLAMRRSGMGLGLYWVRGVARRMGGEAHYACEQNKVVFTLCLPN